MNVLQEIDGSVWALTPQSLQELQSGINSIQYQDLIQYSGEVQDATANRGVLQDKDSDKKYEDDMYEMQGTTAVVPVYGRMYPRANLMTQLSGAVSTTKLGYAIDEIEARDDAERMLMVFDSPGGSVQGLTNTAQKIRNMSTPSVSFAQGLMASAAYFIGSAADEVIASPDSLVGSIGSVVMLKSYHDKLKDEGIDVRIVRSSDKKAKPHPAEPIDEESVKETQRIVDAAYEQFVSQLSINLNIPEQEVQTTMADGKVISGKDADSTNFADSVKTLDEVMGSFEPEDSADEGGDQAFQFLKNQYSDLRKRHSKAIDHIRSLEARIDEMEDEKREQEIEDIVQSAIYDEKKVAPGKEDKLRAQLSNSFEATKSALELMDEGSAAPSSPVEGNSDRDDDPATQSQAVAALRANGFKVAPDADAAQTFERFGQDYVTMEDAVRVARDNDLL